MKPTTNQTKSAWLSGDYTAEQRPVIRATIQKLHLDVTRYRLGYNDTKTWAHEGKFRSARFGQDGPIRELLNIKSLKYSRGVDTDVAQMTLVLYNVGWIADRPSPSPEEFDLPGYYTPTRGTNDYDERWNYVNNTWRYWINPDRIIHTYEGYGSDGAQDPANDAHLYPSGVWIIDDVEMDTEGSLTITARDCGRLLLDQVCFPNIVPFDVYPLSFEKKKMVDRGSHIEPSGAWLRPTYDKDSNQLYEGEGYLDGDQVAIKPDGTVHSHTGAHAFDASSKSHWLSVGSATRQPIEYIQGQMGSTDVSGVKINVRGGPYRAYISLQRDGEWLGRAKIPVSLNEDQIDMDGVGIRYVKSFNIKDPETHEYDLGRVYHGVTKIRLTLVSRWDSGIGSERHYRSAVQAISYCTETARVAGVGQVPRGNYADYTDVVKWLCAWAGFHWPTHGRISTIGGHNTVTPPEDQALPKGSVWGDLRQTKVAGIADLGIDMFDKKPLMDGIAAVRDIVGYDFWVDEVGGIVWRMPNVWRKGNYLMPSLNGGVRTRTQQIVEIDERTTLLNLSVKLSSRNVRDRIFVADSSGRFGATVKGYVPHETGQQRVAGWTDQRFKSKGETRRMADLIAIRQAFLYRTNQLTIAANPAIQIDDQVIIYERITAEGNLHRVTNIDSDWDAETGVWTYTLTTNWLGPQAFEPQAWKPERLSVETRQYLRDLGEI